jgi:hypothetical protein
MEVYPAVLVLAPNKYRTGSGGDLVRDRYK